MLADPTIVTGNPIDDVHGMDVPLCLTQAKSFLQAHTLHASEYEMLMKSLNQQHIAHSVWGQYASQLLGMASLRIINQVSRELKAASAARQGGNTKATKPADLYRKYARTLRLVFSASPQYEGLAKATLTDLYLEQTLSDGDLETPDYVDPYTGEKEQTFDEWMAQIPDKHEPGMDSLIRDVLAMPDEGDGFDGVAPILPGNAWQQELELAAESCKRDLGWTPTDVEQFMKANVQFIGGDDEEQPDDDRGFVPSTLEERELVIDRPVFCAGMKFIHAFNHRRGLIFERMKLEKIKPADWYASFRTSIVARPEFANLIQCITDTANEDITTAAALVLTVAQGQALEDGDDDRMASEGYTVLTADIQHITGALQDGARLSLVDYINEWNDDLLELLGDAGPTGVFPTSERDIERFDSGTQSLLEAKMPEFDANPTATRSWNMMYTVSIADGASIPEAEEAAWWHWRNTMSPEGAKAYDEVRLKTGDRKAAMRAFWKLAALNVPRPQEHIKALRGDRLGLVLASDRRIDWRIAALKARNHELFITDYQREQFMLKLADVPGARVFLQAM